MKALILSTATGQGHNSASLAVKKHLETRGCTAEIQDVLKLRNQNVSLCVSRLYARTTLRSPRFFRQLYRLGGKISTPGGHSPIFRLNTLYADELEEKIRRFRPDVIVCPHIFSAQAITYLREKHGLNIPAAGIATDYTCIPFWEESSLDGYIIPAQELAAEFASKGIPVEKLVPLGIPVSPVFETRVPKAEARRSLGLTAPHVFLVMGGSMGYGKISELATALPKAVPGSKAVVLCGNNEKLFRKISAIPGALPLRFTEKVPLLMDAADVVLTKPGGLSSTEALTKRIPTVLTSPIPGCEQRNAEFLSARGEAFYAQDTEDAVREARCLALDASAAEKMIQAQERTVPKGAGLRIADYLIALGGSAEGSGF